MSAGFEHMFQQTQDAVSPASNHQDALQTFRDAPVSASQGQQFADRLQPGSQASKILGDFQLIDYRGGAGQDRSSSSNDPILQNRHDYLERQWKSDDKDFPSMQSRAAAMADMIRGEKGTLPLNLKNDEFTIDKAADAILKGRPDDLASTLSRYNHDPAKLESVVDELNRQFTDQGSGISLKMQEDGKISLESRSNLNANYKLTLDPRDGAMKGTFFTGGRASFDGAVEKDPEEVARRIAANAVNKIENHQTAPTQAAPHIRNDRGTASPLQIY